MPWQRQVCDTALEVTDDGLAYTWAVVSVGRQCGKTTLVLAVELNRLDPLGALIAGVTDLVPWAGPQRIAYTAQDGASARQKVIQDQWPMIDTAPTPVRRRFDRLNRSAGETFIRMRNGSLLHVLNTTATAGRGKTLDAAVLDEALAHADDTLEAAILPTMVTRPAQQLWITSNVGTSESVYLADKHALGQAFIEAGRRDTVAFFHWGAAEDDDPGDPATWADAIPAYGITINEDALRARYEAAAKAGKLDSFRREYLNVWTQNEVTAVPLTLWAEATVARFDIAGPVALSIEVDLDRTVGTIGGACHAGTSTAVAVVDRRDGTGWMLDRLDELVRRYHPRAIAVDVAGPAASVIPERSPLARLVAPYTARDCAKAAGAFHDDLLAVGGPRLVHEADDDLTLAVRNVRRKAAAGAWLYDRRAAPRDASAFVATVLARDALLSGPAAPVLATASR